MELRTTLRDLPVRGEARRLERDVVVATYRLLARGLPVTATQIAAHAGTLPADVDEVLDGWGGTRRDELGRVLAFGGLDLEPTGHAMAVDGVRLHTWCAFDTLFIPLILGRPAEVESQSPAGGAIRFSVGAAGVRGLTPPSAVLSLVTPPDRPADEVRTQFCAHVALFGDRSAGERWADGRGDIRLVTLQEGVRLGRAHAEAVAGNLSLLSAPQSQLLLEMVLHHDGSADAPPPDTAEGEPVGRGSGTVSGPLGSGGLRWTLNERTGADICAMDTFVTITTDDDKTVRAEGQGFAQRRQPESSSWQVAGAMALDSDDAALAWLGDQLAWWEGSADLSSGMATWRLWLRY